MAGETGFDGSTVWSASTVEPVEASTAADVAGRTRRSADLGQRIRVSVVIACGGDQKRWTSSGSKHLVDIGGEPLLHRTVRQARAIGTVHVAGPYDLPERIDLDPYPALGELNKYYDSRHVWGDRTVILLGDVCYTDDAIDLIRSNADEWVWFSRMGASRLTGGRWGEGFAQAFTRTAETRHVAMLFEAARLKREGALKRAIGWEHYRLMAGGDPRVHADYGMRVDIDDRTEDFDYPADYERWLARG